MVPRISEFFGISIYLYWRHHPPPHFHAVSGEERVAVSIDDLRVLHGRFPPRALALVTEWAGLRQEELRDAWGRAQRLEPLGKIDPLE